MEKEDLTNKELGNKEKEQVCSQEHGDCCGCECGDHECNEENPKVDLEDENGNIVTCEVVDGFEHNNTEYAVVLNPKDKSVYLFKVVGEDGELIVPDDNEFEEASKYYETLYEDEDE